MSKKVIVWGYPFSLSTEPTNNCNLNCIECPTGNNQSTKTKGFQNLELYKGVIDKVKDYTIYQMIYFQGEPFLHPKLFDFIKYADQNKIYTCTSTNGHFLDKENCAKIIQSGLKKIIISLDGSNQKTYEKYRIGGNFEKVVAGIKTLTSVKKEFKSIFPKIHLQFLVFKHNEDQIQEIKKISKQLKVGKLELKSAQIENIAQNSDLIPTISKFSRYSGKKAHQIKTNFPNRCFRIWSTAVISWEGNLIPCCFDKNMKYNFGNVNEVNVKSLWTSSGFNVFRKNILKNRKKVVICRNCSEGLRIKY